MGREIIGTVMEKGYHPPPGAMNRYWCYLLVETPAGARVRVRLHQTLEGEIAVGDKVRFRKPWRKNKRVRDVQRLGGEVPG